jgi:hypothetical protein
MTDEELEDALIILRQRWTRTGSRPVKSDKMLDLILDGEAILQKRWATRPRIEVIKAIRAELEVK